jgi:phosphopantothenoylcysteine decarboxylase/phosphopantothenate--cysteine ligase
LITAFGYSTPIVFVPSMHDSMYKSVSDNIQKIKDEGIIFIDPKREEGKAKFPNISDIILQTLRETSEGKLRGKKVLISAGGTYEEIDSVRGITNRSSGKMGLEIAKEAFMQGADVTIITGRVEVHIPKLFQRVQIESTEEMREEITKLIPESDVFISAAAVSDFTVEKKSLDNSAKISSEEEFTLHLIQTPKIINIVKEINPKILLVAFKAEYNVSDEELVLLARKRMKTSGADFIVANDVAVEGAGFGSDKNQVLIVDDDTYTVPLTSKKEIAQKIVGRIIDKIK